MTEHTSNHSHYIVSEEHEKIKLPLVFSLLIISAIIFLITLSGITDQLSNWITNTLVSNLGYTNKWSKTYGPRWFFQLNSEIGALGGGIFLTLAVAFITGYYYEKRDKRRMWRFLIIILGGGIFMMMMKTLFAHEIISEEQELLFSMISPYPSGHAMMATIFYLTIAIYLTRKDRGKNIRQYYIVVAVFIIGIIGISRILAANHTLTEVLAGWSLGLFWLCVCWLVEKFVRAKGW